jgi:predicted DNA-binding transcriptional regulator AlpA
MIDKGEWLRRSQVARKLNISRVTLWRRMKEGRVPPPRVVAGFELWNAAELDAWLAQQPIKAFAEAA